MKRFLAAATSALVIVLVMAAVAPAENNDAHPPENAVRLLEESIDEVLSVLKNQDLTTEQQKEKIEAVIDPVFNYGLIARLSLGPNNWRKLNREQRDIFVERFVRRLKDSYFENIAMVQGDAETRVEIREKTVQDNRVHVPIRASMKDSSMDMLYKFHLAGDEGWRVYDVEISGVSIVASYRSQFNEVMRDLSVEEMLEQLRTMDVPEIENQ